jgi:hypothetical protein
MGSYDSLAGGENPRIVFIMAIEGYDKLLTTGGAAAAVTAWAGTDWTEALEGLEVNWQLQQGLDPWNAFNGASGIDIRVMDADRTDRFGIDVHRREGGTSTKIAANVAADATTLTVLRADDFAASGTVYLGTEAIGYSSRDTGTDVFSGLTRGKWSPFTRSDGGRFSRAHQLEHNVPGVPPMATAVTTLRTHPTEWVGKWVGVWIHVVRSGGVLDTKAEAHLAFAGRFGPPKDSASGITRVACEDVRQTFKDTVIFRRQLRGRIKEGIRLPVGLRFRAHTRRVTAAGAQTSETLDDLTVVSGSPGANEIEEGLYRIADFESAINNWLADELATGNSHYNLTYRYATSSDDGLRPSLRMDDLDTAAAARNVWLNTAGTGALEIRRALGWHEEPGDSGGMPVTSSAATATAFGAAAPVRVNAGWVKYDTTATIDLEQMVGEFVDQTTFLSPALQQASFADGILRIGDNLFLCGTPTIANGQGTVTVRRVRELDAALASTTNKLMLTVEDAGDLVVTQILILQGIPKVLIMALLTSTGSSGHNSDWDLLPAHCSAQLPYSLLTSDFEAELDAIPDGGVPMTIPIYEPTALHELLNVTLILRNVQPVWRQGRLTLKGWATPTSAATLTLTADDKRTPLSIAGGDSQRAVGEYTDEWWKNQIIVRYNRDLMGGGYRNSDPIAGVDGGAGERRVSLEARNAVRGAGVLAGEDVLSLLPGFIGGLSFLTRPVLLVNVPVGLEMFEVLTPGEVLLFTDPHLRDPSTGERGVTAKPALVVREKHRWGGPRIGENGQAADPFEIFGEVDLMLFPQMSLAAYCPTAEVDHTGLNGGYDTVGIALALKEHAHSESFEDADIDHLEVNDEVTICQIDPDDPAAPLTWNRTIISKGVGSIGLSAALATPSWDAAKKYRVFARNYANATTSQRAKVFQADDADGLVANLREPYGYGHGVQSTTGTVLTGTELARRHVTASYGDGAPLTTGHAYDTAINLNALVHRLTAPHQPTVYSESATFSGSGTWRLVKVCPVPVGVQRLSVAVTRKLWVAPRFKSDDGTSCSVRISLLKSKPDSADPNAPSLMDIVRSTPFVEVTFTDDDTNYVIPAAQALDISHLKLEEGLLGGIGLLITEITDHCVFDGLAEKWLGPGVAP